MLKLRGRIPTDLKEVPASWTLWSLRDRVAAAKGISGYSDEELQSAVAITVNEQPGQVPVGNCCGLMCWGKVKPWGWKSSLWPGCLPSGYALIREGEGGEQGVFLAFGKASDSLTFLLRIVRSRGILTAEAYADKWVADPAQRRAAIAGYKAARARVRSAWKA